MKMTGAHVKTTAINGTNAIYDVSRISDVTTKSEAKRKRKANATQSKSQRRRPCKTLRVPLNESVRTMPRAELEAIAAVSQNGVAPMFTYSDYRNHVEASRKGASSGCNTKRKYVDMRKIALKMTKETKTKDPRTEIRIK